MERNREGAGIECCGRSDRAADRTALDRGVGGSAEECPSNALAAVGVHSPLPTHRAEPADRPGRSRGSRCRRQGRKRPCCGTGSLPYALPGVLPRLAHFGTKHPSRLELAQQAGAMLELIDVAGPVEAIRHHLNSGTSATRQPRQRSKADTCTTFPPAAPTAPQSTTPGSTYRPSPERRSPLVPRRCSRQTQLGRERPTTVTGARPIRRAQTSRRWINVDDINSLPSNRGKKP